MTETLPSRDPATVWTEAWRERAVLLVRGLGFWLIWFAAARALLYAWHWRLVPAA